MRTENQIALAGTMGMPQNGRLLLDSLTSGILAVDLQNRVLYMNSALVQRLRADRDAWLGKPAEELFSLALAGTPARQMPMYRARRTGDGVYSREVQWREGKRVTHLREDSSPLRDETGNITGRLFAYHDLSWEKTVDQMKSEFISIASHELRTPMTSIKGSVDLILRGFVGEVSKEAHELLELTQSACDRMIRLINDILDLSKIEAGQIKLNLAPLNLADAVRHSIRSLEPVAAQKGICLALESAIGLPSVQADRDRVAQIVTNLVANAIKFSPVDGEIRLELSSEAGWVQCSVSDQGCGIKEEDLDRIFGKFQQAGSSKNEGGTGLGLAITHALVTEHRGRIWVESTVGKGSRFVFCLPVGAGEPDTAS